MYVGFNRGVIDEDTREFLIVKHPKLPMFFALPKTQKHLTQPPGRPIVSGISNLTEPASQLMDRHLKPHVQSLFSYTKDTIHLLKHYEGLTVPGMRFW